jgi:2-polyprenyl-3-methyl-5-hydroxy-6-metoxy-1,4-benzoquinol methylase
MELEPALRCVFCQSLEVRKASFPRSTYFNNTQFDYYECKKCRLVFISPLPSADDYAKMYSKTYHEQFYFKEDTPDYDQFYTLLEKYSLKRSIVDYGCGDGSFVKFLSGHGYNCTGVEFDPELVCTLRKKFPAITFYTVEEFNNLSVEQFGTIYMGDVLEHLEAPANFIKNIGRKLVPGGLIMAQGPLENNFTLSLVFRKSVSKFRSGQMAMHIPYHITFSNVQNQKMVFESNGFNTLHYEIYETPWPLPNTFSLKPFPALQWLVGRISIFASQLVPARFGNRFIYLGKATPA